ncbi:membrane protein [Rhodococcus rhodnii]|nr:membrane protein [Rhodococcus rhodnii]
MSDSGDMSERETFARYREEADATEKKVASEIDPGARALVVAVGTVVLLVSLALPHTGSASGFDVLTFGERADAEAIRVPSVLFVWFALVFGVVASMLALVTRRWFVAWIAAAGSAVSMVFGMFAIWTRQTAPDVTEAGPGLGLVLGWLTIIVLTFHWVRVVWSKTARQLEAEERRRAAAAEAEERGEGGPVLGPPL